MPYASYSKSKLDDCGVAVYFLLKGEPRCIPCDKWNDPADNLKAICKSIEAMRGLDRWGANNILDRVFQGFKALPDMSSAAWWDILGVDPNNTSAEEIRSIRLRKAKILHSDCGGSEDQSKELARINAAVEEGLRTLGAK